MARMTSRSLAVRVMRKKMSWTFSDDEGPVGVVHEAEAVEHGAEAAAGLGLVGVVEGQVPPERSERERPRRAMA